MSFHDKLNAAVDKNNSLLCVGLDPDFDKLPDFLKEKGYPQFEFNKAIIDATHDLACVYKPNPAFYESRGDRGVRELKMTCDYIKEKYPEIPVIIDAKRGDIGNTNKGYAQYIFDYLQADALTVMPYMGIGSLSAYFAYKDKGIIVGCHSSNPEAKEFQEQYVILNSFQDPKQTREEMLKQIQHDKIKPLYELVAQELMQQQGGYPNTMIFMGATYPAQLTEIRKIVGDMVLLVPGIGSQGGDTEATVKAGLNTKKRGMMINASRSILFASSGQDFAEKAREEATQLRDTINNYR
ncbi:MAG: orotidine-5'-phosphate decarboxylase [Patescibacteria group bacterium]